MTWVGRAISEGWLEDTLLAVSQPSSTYIQTGLGSSNVSKLEAFFHWWVIGNSAKMLRWEQSQSRVDSFALGAVICLSIKKRNWMMWERLTGSWMVLAWKKWTLSIQNGNKFNSLGLGILEFVSIDGTIGLRTVFVQVQRFTSARKRSSELS